MLSGVVTTDCLYSAVRGEGVPPLATPPRRILLVVDVVVAIAIFWLLLAPSSVGIGPVPPSRKSWVSSINSQDAFEFFGVFLCRRRKSESG